MSRAAFKAAFLFISSTTGVSSLLRRRGGATTAFARDQLRPPGLDIRFIIDIYDE